MTGTKVKVDVRALHAALDAERRVRALSWRRLAQQLGLSASTVSRMSEGRYPDVTAFATMTTWLSVPAETFYRHQDRERAG